MTNEPVTKLLITHLSIPSAAETVHLLAALPLTVVSKKLVNQIEKDIGLQGLGLKLCKAT